eukprot:scaffold7.g3548.t1
MRGRAVGGPQRAGLAALLLVGLGACPAWALSPVELLVAGRSWPLDDPQGSIRVPLGCDQARAEELGVVFSGAHDGYPRCTTRLTIDSDRSSQPLAVGSAAAAANGDGRLLFAFHLPGTAFQPSGSSRYFVLTLEVRCAGARGVATTRSVVHVATSCREDDGEHASAAGLLAAALRWLRPAGRAAAPPIPPPLGREPYAVGGGRSSGGGVWLGAGGAARAARVLVAGDEAASVTLGLGSSDGTSTVDGYSGLVRRIAAAEVPFCSATASASASARREGSTSSAPSACVSHVTLSTREDSMVLSMLLHNGVVGDQLENDTVTVAGGEASVLSISQSLVETPAAAECGSSCQLFDVIVELPVPSTPVTVFVARGALVPYGVNNTASNVLRLIRDTTPPEATIRVPGNVVLTSGTQVSLSITFSEQVLASSPLRLFNVTSSISRYDVVWDLAARRVDLTLYITTPDHPFQFQVWVNRGSVSDLVGNRNTRGVVWTFQYRPQSSGLEGAATAANVVLGGSLALCLAASSLPGALRPFAPSAVAGCGAMSLLGLAQTFYLTGQLSPQWMPVGYRTVADSFGWTVGQIGLPWASSLPTMDPARGFPAVPLALTSVGQEVSVAAVQAKSAGDAAGGDEPVVAVTGLLADLGDDASGGVYYVLPGVPFLTPEQVQRLDEAAPPPPVALPSPSVSTTTAFSVAGADASPSPSPAPELPTPGPALQPSPKQQAAAPSPDGAPTPAAPSPSLAPAGGPPDQRVPAASASPVPSAIPSPQTVPAPAPAPMSAFSPRPRPKALSPLPAPVLPSPVATPPPRDASPQQQLASPPPSAASPLPPRTGAAALVSGLGGMPNGSPPALPLSSPAATGGAASPIVTAQSMPSPVAGGMPSPSPPAKAAASSASTLYLSPAPLASRSPPPAGVARRLQPAAAAGGGPALGGRRALLQAAGGASPNFQGELYVVTSRGLKALNSDSSGVLSGAAAVQRAYDIQDAASTGACKACLPRARYYDRLARTSFWAAFLLAIVTTGHVSLLAVLLWRRAKVPSVLWFPRAELLVCMLILPALAWGESGLFCSTSGGNIALGVVLLLLLPVSFLLGAFLLLRHWLQRPVLHTRRAVFVLQRDPAQLAALADAAAAAGNARAETKLRGGAAGGLARLLRALGCSQRHKGTWISINLDSRFVFKWGPLFEATHGQAMLRRHATYEFDAVKGKVDRGALVTRRELPLLDLFGGRLVADAHPLRTAGTLLGAARLVALAGLVGGVPLGRSGWGQLVAALCLQLFHLLYLLIVRPFNCAGVGGMELTTAVVALLTCSLLLVVNGSGDSDLVRDAVGSALLAFWLVAYCIHLLCLWWTSLTALWEPLSLRRRLGLAPAPADRVVGAMTAVMSRDPGILARKYLDRWMVRALGVGLFNRPVWRRETEDLRQLLQVVSTLRAPRPRPGVGGGAAGAGAAGAGAAGAEPGAGKGLGPGEEAKDGLAVDGSEDALALSPSVVRRKGGATPGAPGARRPPPRCSAYDRLPSGCCMSVPELLCRLLLRTAGPKPDCTVVLPPELAALPRAVLPRTLSVATGRGGGARGTGADAGTSPGENGAPPPPPGSLKKKKRGRLLSFSRRRQPRLEPAGEGEDASTDGAGPAPRRLHWEQDEGGAPEAVEEENVEAGTPTAASPPAIDTPLATSSSVGSLLDPVTPHWATNSVVSDLLPSEDGGGATPRHLSRTAGAGGSGGAGLGTPPEAGRR